jgi:hypothetical protein
MPAGMMTRSQPVKASPSCSCPAKPCMVIATIGRHTAMRMLRKPQVCIVQGLSSAEHRIPLPTRHLGPDDPRFAFEVSYCPQSQEYSQAFCKRSSHDPNVWISELNVNPQSRAEGSA